MNDIKYILTTGEFCRELLDDLFKKSREAEEFWVRCQGNRATDKTDFLKACGTEGKLVIPILSEPSQYTVATLICAARFLGCDIVESMMEPKKTSAAKGEALTDTFLNLAAMDLIRPVLFAVRHQNIAEILEAIRATNNLDGGLGKNIRVLNLGGDNCEHPIRALRDVYTILEFWANHHQLTNRNSCADSRKRGVALLGDPADNSRIKGAADLLRHYPEIKTYFLQDIKILTRLIENREIGIVYQGQDNPLLKRKTVEMMKNCGVFLMYPVKTRVGIDPECLDEGQEELPNIINGKLAQNRMFVCMGLLSMLLAQ